jgi:16S rRNA (uracil1498-N3)-methyltransferase
MAGAKIRLYVDHGLSEGQSVPLTPDQGHYLFGVMRLGVRAEVLVFNGRDGEFLAEVLTASKRNGALICQSQSRTLQMPPDLWLLFAPIKKTRTVFVVEKATEMGAARIVPVLTEFTNNDRVRHEKLQANAVEAAEQCGATYVPPVAELQKLGTVLDSWPDDRRLMFCDEALAGGRETIANQQSGPWAILIGPEGGFSPAERSRLQQIKQAIPVSLGPRILRADTAAVAALTLWQANLGDW